MFYKQRERNEGFLFKISLVVFSGVLAAMHYLRYWSTSWTSDQLLVLRRESAAGGRIDYQQHLALEVGDRHVAPCIVLYLEIVHTKNVFLFCIVLAYSYFELCSKVLSLDNKNKNVFLFCIVLAYSYLCNKLFVRAKANMSNDKIETPPLPLPLRGGERLPPTYPQALPSPQGEGQGWGLLLYGVGPLTL